MARVMALPPPCTTTGWMPAAARKTMSCATPSRPDGSGESMKLPPYLMTKVLPRNRCKYGNASSNTSALEIKASINLQETSKNQDCQCRQPPNDDGSLTSPLLKST